MSRWHPRRARLAPERLEARETPALLLTPVADAASAGAVTALYGTGGNGRYALFASTAANLVPGVSDANGTADLFWADTQTGTVRYVSLRADGTAAGFRVSGPAGSEAVLSFDGLSVAFESKVAAAGLTGDAANQDQADGESTDVFAWSAATGKTKLVSVRTNGTAVGLTVNTSASTPAVSDDGRVVGYVSNAFAGLIDPAVALDQLSETFDLFRRDVVAGVSGCVSVVNGKGDRAVGQDASVRVAFRGKYMDGTGNLFAFDTEATAATVVGGVGDQAKTADVFARDSRLTPASKGTRLVSVARDGNAVGNVAGQAAAFAVVSRSGNAVVFDSNAPGGSAAAALVDNYVNNGSESDAYVRLNPFADAPATQLVTGADGSGVQGQASDAVLTGGSDQYAVSADGLTVMFNSTATNLVSNPDRNGSGADVFVRDLRTNRTTAVSVDGQGRTGQADSVGTALSDDGRYVAFVGRSPDLVPSVVDENASDDVFVRDLKAAATRVVSTQPNGRRTGSGAAGMPLLDAAGRRVLFAATGTDLTEPPLPAATTQLYSTPLVTSGGQHRLAVSGRSDATATGFIFNEAGGRNTFGALEAFGNYNGPVRGTAGDVDGDGTADYVFGIGPGGGSLVRIVSGIDGTDLLTGKAFATFESGFRGGVHLAVADVNGDGRAEVAVAPDQGGGGRIQVFSLQGGTLVQRSNFFGIEDPNFRGGARIAFGDVDGNGTPDLFVGAGFGGGPRVALYDGRDLSTTNKLPRKLVGDFLAFEPGLRNGVFVSSGDVNGDGFADAVFGGGPGGGPRVLVVSGKDVMAVANPAAGASLANFFAFDAGQRGGVRVAVKDVDRDALMDVVVGSGEGAVGTVQVYRGRALAAGSPTPSDPFTPFGPSTLANGVFVG